MLGPKYGILADEYKAYNHDSVIQEKTGVWKWIVPPTESGVAYIRVSAYQQDGGHGANMIVTVNEEIT